MQWVLLATSLLCRAWKALGAVLLGITADGAGLMEEVSVAELSLQSKQKGKAPLSDKMGNARWLRQRAVTNLAQPSRASGSVRWGGDELK